MTDPVTAIRPAAPRDSASTVPLIRLSMGAEIDFLFGLSDRHPTDQVVEALFRRAGNRLGHDACWLAERNGQAAGMLVSYPGRMVRRLDLRTGLHLVSIFGLAATIRLARLQSVYGDLVEAEADEYYISNLAVTPAMQGQGIGAALLAFADRLARRAGFSKCSLIVTFDNPARRLYERCGYRLAHSYRISHPVIAHGSGGFHRMVKSLENPESV